MTLQHGLIKVLKLPPSLVASLFLRFILCLCLLCTIMNTRENIKKVKIWSKKRISWEKEANEQSKCLPIEIIINWRKFYSVSRPCTSTYDDRLNICHTELHFLIERIMIIIIIINIIRGFSKQIFAIRCSRRTRVINATPGVW